MIFWLQWQVFLKVTNRPVGWGEPPVGHRRCRVLLGPSLIIIRVKQILNLPALSDPAYWSTALSYEAPGIISKVISQVLVASQSQQSLQELWRAQLIFWQCWTWNSSHPVLTWQRWQTSWQKSDGPDTSVQTIRYSARHRARVINCPRLHLAPQLCSLPTASIQMIASQEARARQLSLARNKDSDGKINCFSLS